MVDSVPERVFKIISIGNSGVGKTCIIQRLTNGTFNVSPSSTIGMDVQIKCVKTEKGTVVLQLWDTAGQERYRSFTKQYFRKADGVVVTFDVMSEHSFLDLRGWIQSIHQGVDEATSIMILANKIDLIPDDNFARVKRDAAERFKNDFNALYFEVSAKTGENIETSFEEFVRVLMNQEDNRLGNLLNLTSAPVIVTKRTCCS